MENPCLVSACPCGLCRAQPCWGAESGGCRGLGCAHGRTRLGTSPTLPRTCRSPCLCSVHLALLTLGDGEVNFGGSPTTQGPDQPLLPFPAIPWGPRDLLEVAEEQNKITFGPNLAAVFRETQLGRQKKRVWYLFQCLGLNINNFVER